MIPFLAKWYATAANFLPLPSNPWALAGIAVIAVMGWQYVKISSLKADVRKAEAEIATRDAKITEIGAELENAVTQAQLDAERARADSTAFERDALQQQLTDMERRKNEEMYYKNVARAENDELRKIQENADWFAVRLPPDICEQLRLTDGTAGSGSSPCEVDLRTGSDAARLIDRAVRAGAGGRTHERGLASSLQGQPSTDKNLQRSNTEYQGLPERLRQFCKDAKQYGWPRTERIKLDNVIQPWPCGETI